ncbi:helix-turn-helix domain-containing protein [Nostoc sp.]|uniref:helix-turn-helix domain-containing protein n=1 Tax=Nostoc sp. TaxID=1180 RepID=UPI002D76DE75|nr:helix-turn-helix domain-containing protein [Nostoc sp.]
MNQFGNFLEMTPRKIHELSTNLSAIAKILGKHQGTVQRWLAHYRDGRIKGILEFGMSLGRSG